MYSKGSPFKENTTLKSITEHMERQLFALALDLDFKI